MKYMIVHKEERRIVALSHLSTSLKIGCEIFDESGVNLIGIVTENVLFYCAMEIARYPYEKFIKSNSGGIMAVDFALSLCSNWIKDRDSTLIAEINEAGFDCYPEENWQEMEMEEEYKIYDPEYHVKISVGSLCSSIYFYSQPTSKYIAYLWRDYIEVVCNHSVYAIQGDNDLEFERQGEFIINFLFSGKSFFL